MGGPAIAGGAGVGMADDAGPGPHVPWDLTGVIGTGQSLSVGAFGNPLRATEQKNKNLNIETALQRDKYQNLVLTLTSGLVAFTALGAWLLRTLRQKNSFRKTAQIDGLTQVSNRAHFTHCAQKAFKASLNKGCQNAIEAA